MRVFLNLKHWQLVGLFAGIPFLIFYNFASKPFISIPILGTVAILMFAWLWSIPSVLDPLIPADQKLRYPLFKLAFFLITFFSFIWVIYSGLSFEYREEMAFQIPEWLRILIFYFLIFFNVLYLWCIAYVARTIRTAELGRKAKYGEVIGLFFLIWFFLIGIWHVQPRLNRLVCKIEEDSLK